MFKTIHWICYTRGDSSKPRYNLHGRKSLSQFRSDVSFGRSFFFHRRGFASRDRNRDRSSRVAIVTRHIESFLCPSTPCHPIAAGYTCLAERCIDCRSLLCEFAQTDRSPASSGFELGDALRRAEEAAKMEGGLRGRN